MIWRLTDAMRATCHRREKAILKKPSVPALALNSFSRAIEIPAMLRNQSLGAWQKSPRLTALLERFRIRVLGDLHGRKVVDFAHERNCGPKTLYELDLLARRARSRNGNGSHLGHRCDCAHTQHIHSHSLTATASRGSHRKNTGRRGEFCNSGIALVPFFQRVADNKAPRQRGSVHRGSEFG